MVKLSFAHAEGRNYRQLPAKARLREKPSPADIAGMLFFGTEVQAQRSLGFGVRVGSGMKWVQTGFCGCPGLMLALASSRRL